MVLAGIVALLSGCGSFIYHKVRPGETLYSISWRYGQDYRDIAKWNGIPPPYLIRPGLSLRVAPPTGTVARTRSVATPPALQGVATPPPAVPDRRPLPVPPASNEVFNWQWPAKGKVLRAFSNGNPRHPGIDIAGATGAPVRAVAAGTVVYSGSGLAHYGKLLIIKHNDSYLSAYAHNDRLLVAEGAMVGAGQAVAEMGNSGAGTRGVSLYFEIRVDGVPVDPLKYLPPR